MPDFPTQGGASAAQVWAYGTRALSGTDIADIKAVTAALPDAGALTSIAQEATVNAVGALATSIDTVTAALPDAGALTSIAQKSATDKLLMAGTPVEASIEMDGTDMTLVEFTDAKVGEVEVWLDLNPMQAGDTIVVSYSRKVRLGGDYQLYAQETYADEQSVPLVKIMNAKIYRDTKVTAQQTVGINRTLDVQAIRIVEA